MKLQLQFSTIAAAAVLSLSSAVAWAHFGIVIPEHSAVLEQKDANVHFTIAFAHPMGVSAILCKFDFSHQSLVSQDIG